MSELLLLAGVCTGSLAEPAQCWLSDGNGLWCIACSVEQLITGIS